MTFIDDGTAFCVLIPLSPKCSTKPPTDDDKSGVGIAVGVTVAVVTTTAYIGNNVNIDAKTVNVETTAPKASTYSATAISGAGGTSVGVAGSIAVLVVDNSSTTDVEGSTGNANATLDGDLSLSAGSNLTNTSLATAKQASDGSTSGIGASFALDVVNDTTTAGLPDSSTISGANNLTISSTDTDDSSTTANGGASAGSGSFALSAQVAITLANVTTTASVGTGDDLTIGGALNATAVQTASAKTIASGASMGGSATIGLSLALALVNDNVSSELLRDLTAGGAVSFSAAGVSNNDTEATASSTGSPGKKDSTQGSDDGQKNPKDGMDEGTVNQKADKIFQITAPVVASSATRCASIVAMYTRLSITATPRFVWNRPIATTLCRIGDHVQSFAPVMRVERRHRAGRLGNVHDSVHDDRRCLHVARRTLGWYAHANFNPATFCGVSCLSPENR